MDASNKDPRQSLIDTLIEANKRAVSALDGARLLGGKLFGPSPMETAAGTPEMSVQSLAGRLIGTLCDLEHELGRQNNAVGEINAPPSLQQGRAVGY